MDPVTRAALLSWDFRLDVILVLVLLGSLFVRGWWRLRKRSKRRGRWSLAAPWRLVSYLTGLVFIGISLMSPIDVLSQQLFTMHMIQHLLLIMVAPPLLLIANPMPIILWGLPDGLRRRVGFGLSSVLHRRSGFRQGLRSATGPGVILLVWVIALIGWHDPNMYNAALRYEWVHDLEHISFFAASMLFWWHVTGAGPHIHKQFGGLGRVGYVIAAVPPNMALGVVLAFIPTVAYSYYEAVPTLWGIDPLTDQKIGGVIMWIPGSMMYIIAALILITRVTSNDNKPARGKSVPRSNPDNPVVAPTVAAEGPTGVEQ